MNRFLRKNKYNLFLLVAFIVVLIIIGFFIKAKIDDINMAKYDNNIIIIKGNGDEIKSFSIRELKKRAGSSKEVYINNGLEKVKVEGVSLEKLVGNLDYNLRERPVISIEDTDGNSNRFPMSVALEVDRVYLVYRIDGEPVIEYNPSYGSLVVIDTTTKSANSWITNVKTLNIQ
ncbi:hypothetical protein HMPREF0072_0387 [Anaerococcus lactolyticus ATCC 51172]|uniref:Oxidoreductase molybdopterin binding domain protein n=3 Tax=Anaerococcus lactolyticus TaxID=33032 RepID=C2BDG7_9FIRM|nr:hypothetical protein [Anaerococcus lactolyticus]EEI86996.1 hypothetical protein HMPREF0072_0387 [Anaerococcus lactolyticus ATCC 51172]